MRQVSDLRQALAHEVDRLEAARGLERRVLDAAFRRPSPLLPSSPVLLRTPAAVAVLVTIAILVVVLFGAYQLQQHQAIPGTHPLGGVDVTEPVAIGGPLALDCNNSCDMPPPVFANANAGWVTINTGGRDATGTLYRTDDGGRHWNSVISWDCGGATQIETTRDGREATIVLASYMCDGSVLHTSDAGAHWTSSGIPLAASRCISIAGNCQFAFSQVEFVNTKEGFLFAQGPTLDRAEIFRTDDSGAHWAQTAASELAPELRAALVTCDHCLYFTSTAHGWLIAIHSSIEAMYSIRMFRTTDGGKDWQARSVPSPGTLEAVRFFDANEIAMTFHSGSHVNVATSADDGATWTSRALPAGVDPLEMIDAKTWYALAPGGLERTSDWGNSWTLVGALPDNACCWLSFADASHGWAYSGSGSLYATADGGAHWTSLPTPVAGAVYQPFPQSGVIFSA